MDKKKNYSKKAGGKGLMAAISDYQRESKQKETYKPKKTPKLDSKKAKNNTSQAYGSGKNFGAMLKKDPPKAKTPPKKDPPKKDPPKKDPPKNDPPKTSSSTPDRVSKFLGGQTVQEMLDKKKKLTKKEQAALDAKRKRGLLNSSGQTLAQQRAARQAATNAAMKKKREEEKKRRNKSGSSWAKGKLKGL